MLRIIRHREGPQTSDIRFVPIDKHVPELLHVCSRKINSTTQRNFTQRYRRVSILHVWWLRENILPLRIGSTIYVQRLLFTHTTTPCRQQGKYQQQQQQQNCLVSSMLSMSEEMMRVLVQLRKEQLSLLSTSLPFVVTLSAGKSASLAAGCRSGGHEHKRGGQQLQHEELKASSSFRGVNMDELDECIRQECTKDNTNTAGAASSTTSDKGRQSTQNNFTHSTVDQRQQHQQHQHQQHQQHQQQHQQHRIRAIQLKSNVVERILRSPVAFHPAEGVKCNSEKSVRDDEGAGQSSRQSAAQPLHDPLRKLGQGGLFVKSKVIGRLLFDDKDEKHSRKAK
mmetsp:Transcript_25807/g.50490  ORF Transcript_25807/g.50490 Transcript_25807/m.50490 type:complete len:338 (+) Transcript_25807:466-1479(+)